MSLMGEIPRILTLYHLQKNPVVQDLSQSQKALRQGVHQGTARQRNAALILPHDPNAHQGHVNDPIVIVNVKNESKEIVIFNVKRNYARD